VLQPNLVGRREAVRGIERCTGDVDGGRVGRSLIGQRAAAPTAKPAHDSGRRLKRAWAAGKNGELRAVDGEPCDRGRAGGAAARNAVADARRQRCARNAISSRTAEAPALARLHEFTQIAEVPENSSIRCRSIRRNALRSKVPLHQRTPHVGTLDPEKQAMPVLTIGCWLFEVCCASRRRE
jgi:hypothetical protein